MFHVKGADPSCVQSGRGPPRTSRVAERYERAGRWVAAEDRERRVALHPGQAFETEDLRAPAYGWIGLAARSRECIGSAS